MASSPSPKKSKKGFRKFLSETYHSVVRTPASQHPPNVPGSSAGHLSSSWTSAGPSSSVIKSTESGLGPALQRPLSVASPKVDTDATSRSVGGLPATNKSTDLGTGYSSPSLFDRISRKIDKAGLKFALQGLYKSVASFPPLQSAIGALISCLDATTKNREEYEVLASELRTLCESLTRHMKASRSIPISGSIAHVALSIEQQANQIKDKQSRGTGGRILESSIDEDNLIKHFRRIESLFRQLQIDAALSTWSIANEHLANTRLEGLKPAKLARYDSALSTGINRRMCTENTRVAVLSDLNNWSHDPSAADMYWMDGMAGTGKTTIACSFSRQLEAQKQLAASFFCSRLSPECRMVARIVPTIVYQLARYSIPFQGALCEVLGNDPDIGTTNIPKQFERLLAEPLMKVKAAMPADLVVVIDALDECEDRDGIQSLLDLLFQFAGGLPLKFFVTSRPEPEIYRIMVSQVPNSRTVLHLHEIERSLVQADIALYLKEELGRFMSPSPDQIEQLSQRSGNLFIYAATLVRHVQLGNRLGDHQKRLNSLLATTPHSTKQYAQLDGLYATVLKSALNGEDLDEGAADDVQAVLRAVICTQEPVDIETLAALAGLNDTQRARSSLQPLRSVLHLSENSGLVSTLHASFPDFMFTQERSGPFYCDATENSQTLTRECFRIMHQQLRFNICNLESSFIADKDVHDLPDRIIKYISSTLSYVCRYWADHLASCKSSEELCLVLGEFLSSRLLFWMEVLNLKGITSIGMEVLPKAKRWLQDAGALPEVIRLVKDAQIFVTTFAGNPVSQSTPHIYTSLLPFCPKSSAVSEHYRKRTRGLIEAKGSGMDRRDAAALANWKTVSSEIWSVAYSVDGSRVAFGCEDGVFGIRSAYDGSLLVGPVKAHDGEMWGIAFSPSGAQIATCGDHVIRLWDVRNGAPVTNPFEGHSDTILSISFAPDGARIASGSDDCTIRVWAVNSGALLINPFEGHTGGVKSVAFSPDGTRIVSGSGDQTVRVWNSTNGTLVAEPFVGHTKWVRSVAFSLDGTRVVSGSYDQTVRVWTADGGALVAGPFEGHTNWIMSVAFSPDGTRIASVGNDCTVRVWNVCSDAPASAGIFEGHTNSVNAVAFSPDGTHIISGSSDYTLRMWGTLAASLTSNPPEGHTNWVLSAAFSPDGTHIASGSYDRTVRFWDPQHGTSIYSPLHGHDDAVRSVAFSPSGTLIASASYDHTVRVWNLHDSVLVTEPFEGHTDWVMSVAFSPDGTRVVSGSVDQTIRIWGIPDGNL
ncbi:hypothetical protein CTheo_4522 [Ceratobasidium theobromae]|uniref:NACHT domain-containing protein n=1 Tax=Ceratobasidium theobromae TaxID=1582974 RepID=A0A5N5QK10_9AGAM|nr:hypothetical protein CTheo_4522 [Ceratobasidium theobromae]